MSQREICISFFVILLKVVSVLSQRDGSLVFVIDNTVSMADEIKQLQDGFDSILDVTATKPSQIQNVVLVTFNDPDWLCSVQQDNVIVNTKTTLVTKSFHRDLLKTAMNSVTTFGGGDTPEYSLTGILDALRHSNHNSYIFAFTDAAPKDYHLKEDVKSLAQEKSTQIFFVLTPNCNEDEDALDPYYDIATATFGSVFRLRAESEIQQIINFVREMSSGERTILLAKVVPGGQTHKTTFTVDEQIEYIVILVSGENVTLSAKFGEKITWLSNVKAAKLMNPTHGDYEITVGGKVMTSVLVYGITNSTFDFAFFDIKQNFMNETSKSCVVGTKKHLAIIGMDEKNINIESVELADTKGNLFREFQLKKVDDFYTTTELFMPSNSAFLIIVTGKLITTGKTIKRIARTPIDPNIGPKVDKSLKTITANETSTVTIECKILESKPEPKITWQFRSMTSNETKKIPENGRSITIEKVNLKKAGYYTCTAQNICGFDNNTVKLSVSAKPVVSIISEAVINTVDYNSNLTLSCKVTASPKPNIVWEINNKETSTTMQDRGTFKYASNLVIHQIKRSNEYSCKAFNAVGEAVMKYNLTVNYPFKSNNTEEEIKIPYGENVILNCKVESSVPLHYDWFLSNGTKFDTNTTSEIMFTNGKDLKIYNVMSLEEIYKCKASISDDEGIYILQTFKVRTTGKGPKIDQSHQEVIANESSTVTLDCKILEGIPAPNITWQFRPSNMFKSWSRVGYTTTIENVGLHDEGIYTCKAENIYGSDIKMVNLTVTAPPKIEKSLNYDEKKGEKLFMEGGPPNIIQCRIQKGKPPPKIQWYKRTPAKVYENYEVSSENKEKITVKDSGYYKCVASNVVGRDEMIVELISGGSSA